MLLVSGSSAEFRGMGSPAWTALSFSSLTLLLSEVIHPVFFRKALDLMIPRGPFQPVQFYDLYVIEHALPAPFPFQNLASFSLQ